jgi:signal-transduction protein with cAMP-binding, CBS, and nucleotidyltransferase domain
MTNAKISSLVVADDAGKPLGIVTERDLLRAFSLDGRTKMESTKVSDLMASPVITVCEDDFVFIALGRIERRGIRHLVVVDGVSRAVGMVTPRGLLKVRVGDTLRLGDEIDAAHDAQELGHVRSQLPELARQLLAEDVGALGTASVISAVYCDLTRRAWDLAVATLQDEGKGAPPAPYSVLVLGSGGRGESLLKPDQDNAIVHLGDVDADGWFKDAAARMSATLDAAGVPFCKGNVMASNADWRRSLDGWRGEIGHWVKSHDPEALLMTDIFFDLKRAAGDGGLADQLHEVALHAVHGSVTFLHAIGLKLDTYVSPIGLLGKIKTIDNRVDLKLNGLLPITAGVRVMALQHGLALTSTSERLKGLVVRGALGADDARQLADALEVLLCAVLNQQTVDIKAGLEPSTHVDVRRLDARRQHAIKQAFKAAEGLKLLVHDSLGKSGVVPGG